MSSLPLLLSVVVVSIFFPSVFTKPEVVVTLIVATIAAATVDITEAIKRVR